MKTSLQTWISLYICCLLQLYYVSAVTYACQSNFYSIPTVKGARFPGGWAFVSSTSSTAYCKKKGFYTAGAIRTRALGAFGFKGRVAFNLGTNKTCAAAVCGTLIGVECIRAGAQRCVADRNGNIGRANVGKDNFGTRNRGRGNIGNANIGTRCSGVRNQGDLLTGYNLQGYKVTGKFLSNPTSAVLYGKPPPPKPPPRKRAPPPNRKTTPPSKDDTPPAPGQNFPPPPSNSPPDDTCPPCDCGLDIYDPNEPPSPPPAPSPPGDLEDGEELPSSCTNPCFKYDPENKTCSKSICTDPCKDCFISGNQTACLEIFGLNRFSSESACKADVNCDPTTACLNCADGKWACVATLKKKIDKERK